MTIAYLIQVHKCAKQIKTLINCLLANDKNHCFIHVDKKSVDVYKELQNFYRNHSRVSIINECYRVNWSGFSQVKASLSLMKSVYQHATNFDRIQLMSGEDFPVKSLEYIDLFMYKNKDKEFIEFEDMGKYSWRILQYNFFTEFCYNRNLVIRIVQRTLRELQKLLSPRNIFESMCLYKGASWFNLSIEAMDYILHYIDNNPQYIKQFYKTACADEHFFQMILLNSNFKDKIINSNLYYTQWQEDQSSPMYLDIKGIAFAKSNDSILFARKINEYMAEELSKDCK